VFFRKTSPTLSRDICDAGLDGCTMSLYELASSAPIRPAARPRTARARIRAIRFMAMLLRSFSGRRRGRTRGRQVFEQPRHVEDEGHPPVAENRGTAQTAHTLEGRAEGLDDRLVLAVQPVDDDPGAREVVPHDDDALPLGLAAARAEEVA